MILAATAYCAPMRTIRLYGKLGAKFGRVHHLAVASPGEAVRALAAIIPGFEAFMYEAKDAGLGFAVFLGKRNISQDELGHPPGRDDIRIAPILLGSKNAGVFNVILGAVMIVVGVVALYFGQAWGVSLIYAGAAMMIGGIVQMLAPQPKDPKADDEPANRASYAFNGPVNTQAQGGPVPCLFGGPMKVGSAVISASIEAKDDVYVPAGGAGNVGGGGGSYWAQMIQNSIEAANP